MFVYGVFKFVDIIFKEVLVFVVGGFVVVVEGIAVFSDGDV